MLFLFCGREPACKEGSQCSHTGGSEQTNRNGPSHLVGGVCLTLAHNELQGLRSAGRGNVREPAEYTETTRPSMRTVHPAVGTRSSHITAQPLRMGRPETIWVRETGWADRWAAARADRTAQARITGCTEEVQVPPQAPAHPQTTGLDRMIPGLGLQPALCSVTTHRNRFFSFPWP